MLGPRIAQLREARGWERPELARRARLTRDSIAKLETGQRSNPHLDTLCKLRSAFNITLDELVQCPDSDQAA